MKQTILPLFLLIFGCRTTQPITGIAFKDYVVSKATKLDSSYTGMLKPYTDSVGKTMDQVLVSVPKDLLKEVPNSSLGNFLADAYLDMARDKFDKRADIAFMNHGGVRINRIGAGEVTRRMIYEVMPFDNLLVIVEVKGDVLQAYLDKLASEGGGGGVAGLSMGIKDKKAVDVRIGGKSIELGRTYYMVNSDYAVDGGGGFTALKKLKQQRTQYFLRDAIIDYCSKQQSKGQSIPTEPSIRITNE
jgi:2',3'-cyclic-nucleotide 2'-phosphodiesterase (5'-nucleotidase family)